MFSALAISTWSSFCFQSRREYVSSDILMPEALKLYNSLSSCMGRRLEVRLLLQSRSLKLAEL